MPARSFQIPGACARERGRVALKLTLSLVVTVLIWGAIIHLYWIQVGVRQDATISYQQEPVYSPYLPVRRNRLKPVVLRGVLTAFRGTVVSNLRDLVKYTVKACEHFRLRCWLDSSTLLGSYRNGRIFPWEEDGDIGILEEDFGELENLSKAGKFRQFARGKIAGIESPKLRWSADFDIIFRPGEDHLSARAVDRKTQLYIDFFKFKRVGENIETPSFSWAWVHCAHCKTHPEDRRKAFSFPFSEVFPLKPCTIEGIEAMCPRNTVSYLTYIFGNDFRDPPIEYRSVTKVSLYLLGFASLCTLYCMVVRCLYWERTDRTL